MSSQYLILTRWMSRRGLLRSLGRCCLGLVALLVAGGAAEVLPVSLNCPLPLRRTHPPTLVCCFCSNGSNQHKIWAAGGKSVFFWEARWEEPIWEQFYFQLFQESGDFAWSSVRCCLNLWRLHDPKEPVLLTALKITRHAKLCLSVIMFLICVCWHPERMCRALSTCGQRGQV